MQARAKGLAVIVVIPFVFGALGVFGAAIGCVMLAVAALLTYTPVFTVERPAPRAALRVAAVAGVSRRPSSRSPPAL